MARGPAGSPSATARSSWVEHRKAMRPGDRSSGMSGWFPLGGVRRLPELALGGFDCQQCRASWMGTVFRPGRRLVVNVHDVLESKGLKGCRDVCCGIACSESGEKGDGEEQGGKGQHWSSSGLEKRESHPRCVWSNTGVPSF